MKHDIEKLLQQALSPNADPSPWLNQKILQTVKEKNDMSKKYFKKPFGAAAVVATLLICSLGAFAGWKYLAPNQVAENFADTQLSKAFQSEDAIFINEIQEFDNYTITLLGIVSGKNLSEYTQWDERGMIKDDRTYIVTAIENADGTPRPDVSDEAFGKESFYVSPYIQGLSMNDYNAHTLGGGYSEDTIDGVQYRITECDNIEMFAYKTIYLGITEGNFPDITAFIMDMDDGTISQNTAYSGINALFTLPIPAYKGDEAAVEKYLKEMEAESSDTEDTALDFESFKEKILTWSVEDFEQNAKNVYSEELIPDSDGYISYNYKSEKHGCNGTITMDSLFPEMQTGLSDDMFISGDTEAFESFYIETYELLENGNVMLRVYYYETN